MNIGRGPKNFLYGIGITLGASITALPVHAALTLTPAGISAGFSLTTFYSDSAYYGMLQATTTSSGQVLATGYARDELYLLPDVDGQNYGTITTKVSLGGYGSAYSVATVGGKSYFSPGFGGTYYQVNTTTLALTPLSLDMAVQPFLGLWGNQATGHLVSSSNLGLVDIDPITGHVRVITPTSGFDGVSVSPDGKTVYGAIGGSTVLGYDIATGTQVLNAVVGRGVDGTGVISGTAYAGFIVADNNDGTIGLIDPATGIETIIAEGGTRGDFVGPDLTNGTLFVSTADMMYRLKIAGGTIGGPGVPEPATWLMMIGGFGMVGAAMRRRTTVSFA